MRRTRSRMFRVHSDSSAACFSAPPRHLARVCQEALFPSLIFGWEEGACSDDSAPNLVHGLQAQVVRSLPLAPSRARSDARANRHPTSRPARGGAVWR
ncbi:hypothetical protein L1887_40509 [Cichorium endivia]|nr:hypothetical protein L1887_40509 [Cichorium endivia]